MTLKDTTINLLHVSIFEGLLFNFKSTLHSSILFAISILACLPLIFKPRWVLGACPAPWILNVPFAVPFKARLLLYRIRSPSLSKVTRVTPWHSEEMKDEGKICFPFAFRPFTLGRRIENPSFSHLLEG